jgi:hypothetical protein
MKTAKIKPKLSGKRKKKEEKQTNKSPFGEGFSREELNRYEEEETRQSGTAGVA